MPRAAHRALMTAASALALGLAAATAPVAIAPACAQARVQPIAIEAGPLDAALLKLSADTGVLVLVDPALVKGKTAPALKGPMTPDEALGRLLRGTGLTFRRDRDGSYVVVRAQARAEPPPVRSPRPPALDQAAVPVGTIEEVIVTAEKREESLQRIPIAISAFSGERMEQAGVTGIDDLRLLAPSVQFGRSMLDNFVSIRGIGAELINVGAEAGVTIAQDGVPFSNQLIFDADFFDVERVEVLRGPQGTIAGRNATGGAVNIHSKRPTADFEGGLKATVGNYRRVGLEGRLSGPIAGENLLGRLAVRTERADGWLHNTFLDREVNDVDKVHARASILYAPTAALEAHLILEGLIDRSVGATNLDFGRVRADQPGFAEARGVRSFNRDRLEYEADFSNVSRVETYKGFLRLTWSFGDAASLTSTTGYLRYDRRLRDDFDATRIAASHFERADVHLWQASQELTLAADLSDRLDVILGALYLRVSARQPLLLGLPLLGLPERSVDFRPDQDLRSYAAYTQWRYRLARDLRLSVGARYTRDEKDFVEETFFFGGPAPLIRASKSWGAFTPRVALDYTPSPDLTLYASVSRGFKAGGFNTFSGRVDEFAPEFVWNYEVGMKAHWLDRRLRTAFAAFHMDYRDLQQNLVVFNPELGLALPSVENAGQATIAGVELEVEALVGDHLQLAASGTWLDAKYDALRSADPVFPELGERDLAGNRLVRAPEWQFSLSAEYKAPLADGWVGALRADYQWQSEVFFTYFNHALNRQGDYGLLNVSGRIETDDGRWRVSAFARNLLDERYVTNALTAQIPETQLFGNVGPPRMYGLSLEYRF